MQMVHSRSFPHYFFSLFRGSVFPFFFLLYQNLDEKLDEQPSILPKSYEVSIERFRGHETVRCFLTPFLPTLGFSIICFFIMVFRLWFYLVFTFSIIVLLGVYIFDYGFIWCLPSQGLWFCLGFVGILFRVLIYYSAFFFCS